MIPIMCDGDEGEKSRRQVARRERRDAGDRSARVANAVMKLPASAIAKLELDEELRAAVDRARAVTSLSARRRAERTLAGELRGHDVEELEKRLAAVQGTGVLEQHMFH